MLNKEHLKLPDWVRELRPNIIWFLLTLVGSAAGVEIVRSIPDPSAQTIVIGIGLCVNASLIAWLTWRRTEDRKEAARERKILLQRIVELQRVSKVRGLHREAIGLQPEDKSLHREAIRFQHEDMGLQREEPARLREPMSAFEHLSELEGADPDVAKRIPRMEIGDARTSQRPGTREAEPLPKTKIGEPTPSARWSIREEDAHKQWKLLNRAEQAMVKFVLLRGTATATQLLQFRDHEGSRPTDTCDRVKSKTSFFIGDLDSGLMINPEMKPYLEKIVAQDKNRTSYI